jgi:hypothetical protein
MPIVNFLTTLLILALLLPCRGKSGVYLVRIVNNSAIARPALVIPKGLPNLLFSSWKSSRQSDVDHGLALPDKYA